MKLLKSFAFVASFLFAASSMAAEELSGPAPDFTLPSNKGTNIRLEEHRGKVVMINFLASWCGPCRQEMPLLDDLYQRYNKAGFVILGVSLDDTQAKTDELLSKIPVTFPVLYDTESSISELYNVAAMPTTVMVDRNGNMRYLHKGYKPGFEEEYKKQVRELIRE